jgi:hypothetical protein
MRIAVGLGIALAMVIVAPVSAAKPSPSCVLSTDGTTRLLVQAIDLRPGTYWAWWSAAHEEDGQPFYYAGTSEHRSDGKTWSLSLPTTGHDGYVYAYVVPFAEYGSFDPANAVAECEIVT